MSELRRLIEQAVPGSLRHSLLRAGRRAEPSAGAPRELTERLLAQLGEVPAGAAASKAAAFKLGVGATQASLLLKLGAVVLVGAAGAIAWLQRTSPPPSTDAPALAPSAAEASAAPTPQVLSEASSAPAPQAAPESPAAAVDGVAVPTTPAILISPRHGRGAPARARSHPRLPAAPPSAPAPSPSAAPNPSIPAAPSPSSAPSASVSAASPSAPAASSLRAPSPSNADRVSLPSELPAARDRLIDTRLQAELSCLDAVRRALQGGDATLAQRLLADYRTRFPEGYLAPEARRLAQQLELRAPAAR